MKNMMNGVIKKRTEWIEKRIKAVGRIQRKMIKTDVEGEGRTR